MNPVIDQIIALELLYVSHMDGFANILIKLYKRYFDQFFNVFKTSFFGMQMLR